MKGSLLVLGIALLGGLGALVRLLLDGAVETGRLGAFPFGTLVVNLSGSFLLGLVLGLGLEGDGRLLVATAALGSYTTFSTWLFETHRLLQDGQAALAGANLAVSVVAGIVAFVLGQELGMLV